MISDAPLTVGELIRRSLLKVSFTWLTVVVEVALIAIIPLFLGRAIDRLLDKPDAGALVELSLLLAVLITVGVGRRIYDTRIYGTMRVALGAELMERSSRLSLSRRNARISMAREIVDFLEEHTPQLIANVISVVFSVMILFSFDAWLGWFCVVAVAVIVTTYSFFHPYFFSTNARLNETLEKQVAALESGNTAKVRSLLTRVRDAEVKISDANAVLYGLVFAAMFGLVVGNLWLASQLPGITVGTVFAILSYSWEVVESSTQLPDTLQQWSRLSEIQKRINSV